MTKKPTTPDLAAEAEAKAAAEAQTKTNTKTEAQLAADLQTRNDQAKFDDHQAQLKAVEQAQLKAVEDARAAKPARKAKPKLASAEDLRAAIKRVEAGNHANGRAALVEGLVQDGAKIEDRENAVHIDWLGVKMQTTAGLPNALTVWCSKARRAILNGEAE